MKKFLHQTGAIVMALILTFSILYFFRNSKHFGVSNRAQHNMAFEVLDTTLDLLGKRVVALVQDDAEKKDVEADFNEFRQRVYRQEVPPEELERIIAKVYSSNSDKEIMSLDEIENILVGSVPKSAMDSAFVLRPEEREFHVDSIIVHPIPERATLADEELLERYSNIAQITVFENAVREKSKYADYATTIEFDPDSGLRVRLDSTAYRHFLTGSDEELQALTERLADDKLLMVGNTIADYESLLQQTLELKLYGDSIGVQVDTHIKSPETQKYIQEKRFLKAAKRKHSAARRAHLKLLDSLRAQQDSVFKEQRY